MAHSGPEETQAGSSEADQDVALTAALAGIAEAAPEDGLSLGAFSDALGERVFGALLFALAIPVCMPFLYGVPQVVALPMMAIAVQMAAGRTHPWMPKSFRDRPLDKASLVRIARWSKKWFGWLEALARPRLTLLSGPTAERVVGAIFVLFCTSILIPLPTTNTAPGIGIAIASIGLITRDGLLVLAGLILGIFWISLLIIGFTFFGAAFIDLLKEFILGLFGARG
ncbi:exopolysaccharide biosynthesis protein [Oceanicaulis sp. LC35]|uniref:exopolysaccharide biosynthesis protein n=1 Tax=Oceanicaulis sp. LC35 TaxID=3349635 RepID=UPI003F85E53D